MAGIFVFFIGALIIWALSQYKELFPWFAVIFVGAIMLALNFAVSL